MTVWSGAGVLGAFAVTLGIGMAHARAQDVCGQFTWSVGEKIDLFTGYVPTFKSGQGLPKDGVYAVDLLPGKEVLFFLDPDRSRRQGFGAVVTIENVPSGRFRIAITEEARLDAIQDNALLPVQPVGYDPACPSIRFAVEVNAEDGPLTIQISGANRPWIRVGVARIWSFE
jgi:hypothetical protein